MYSTLDIVLAGAYPLVGALIYRMRGGFPPKLPRPVDLGLWAGLITAPLWWLVPWWAAALCFVAAFAATSTAHGEGMDMGKAKARDLTEWANWPTRKLLGHQRDGWTYDTVYMAFSGVVMTVLMGVALMVFVTPWLAVIGLCGALKGPAYAVGWVISDTGFRWRHFSGAEWGEWLTGLLVAGTIGLLWLI